jgi:hypothetical protein
MSRLSSRMMDAHHTAYPHTAYLKFLSGMVTMVIPE